MGDNVTIGGQVGIGGHIKIGNNVMVAAKSGITGNIKDNQVLGGHPVVSLQENLKIQAGMKKLPELLKRVKKLEQEQNNK